MIQGGIRNHTKGRTGCDERYLAFEAHDGALRQAVILTMHEKVRIAVHAITKDRKKIPMAAYFSYFSFSFLPFSTCV